ncbi:MAG: M20/M25/M40 family metallo-hydrolase [Candidatus Acidiferrales bacterium]
MLKPEMAEKILSHVREEEILKMACDVVNIPSPTGEELEMGKYMRAAMEGMGLDVTWQEVEPGRANVVGIWEGHGAARNLMFNGHMDTSNTGRETYLSGIGYKAHALIKNGMIYGLGIYNMKGALICYLNAVNALRRAGLRLEGSIFIAAVVGEIEKTQWGDEFIGSEYRGYGVGTHYLVNHGIVPDMCILGEPTDMQMVLGHYGTIWVRFTTHGPYVHTAFTRGREQETSIRRMQNVLSAVQEWIPSWEEKASYGGHKGIVNIGCIRGGYPWRASRAPERTDLCLDLRVPPTMQLQEARKSAKQLYLDLRKRFPDYELGFEVYVSVPGAEIDEKHDLVKTIEATHRRVMGTLPKRSTVHWDSDASVMTRYGIETLNYGPSSGERDAEGEKVAIETLVNITKIYALAAAEICGAS